MKRTESNHLSRRAFLGKGACAAVGTTGILSTLFDLRLMNHAVAAGSLTDYKALVCIFFYGGNDANNLVVPRTGSAYTSYATARSNLALPSDTLLPINPLVSNGVEYGLHPSCTGLQALFEAGKLGIIANVGTLIHPVTKTQYQLKTVPLPPQLFSHNDQQVQWQTSASGQLTRSGWGGRCADLLNSLNVGAPVSMSISVAGANTFEVGNTVQQYQVTTGDSANGFSPAVSLSGVTGTNLSTYTNLLQLPSSNLFVNEFARVNDSAVRLAALINTNVNTSTLTTVFPSTNLGRQLREIARLIKCRDALSLKRQIFFASMGSFDTHGEQLINQANLFTEISGAMSAFQAEMDASGLGGAVTTFTASDFGRTFPSNGIGSDHGWGSHQLVMGGAVQGKKFYGSMPALIVNGPDDTGLGRWIPTTSVDQYSSTLARWFGVSDSDLSYVFPNIGNFPSNNLGFLG